MAIHAPIIAGAACAPGIIPEFASRPCRRRMLGLIATVPFAGGLLTGTQALALEPTMERTPFKAAKIANKSIEARFNALPVDLESEDPARYEAEEDLMIASWQRVTTVAPASWAEFVQQLDILTSDGAYGVNEDKAAMLLNHARQLLGSRA